jgi:hypothetical protein
LTRKEKIYILDENHGGSDGSELGADRLIQGHSLGATGDPIGLEPGRQGVQALEAALP